MKRKQRLPLPHRNGVLHAFAAFVMLGGAMFFAACDGDSPTAVQEGAVGEVVDTQETGDVAPVDIPTLLSAHEPNCLNDLPGEPDSRFNNAVCTANEVKIKVLQVVAVDGVPHDPDDPIVCTEGETVDVDLIAFFGLNANSRYDASYYFNTDGGDDARTGQCFHGILEPLENGGAASPVSVAGGADPTLFDGPYRDLEEGADICGDIDIADETPLFGQDISAIINVPETIPLTCADPDEDGFLSVGTCTSWEQNANDAQCNTVDDAVPGTPSKCFCEPAQVPVLIQREASVTVVKDLNPASDPGRFDLTIEDFEGTQVAIADDAGDGDEASHTFNWFADDEPTENVASVEELIGTPNPGLAFYDISYSCTEANNGNGPLNGTGTGPQEIQLENGDDWTCTFVNDRIGVPTVEIEKTVDTSYDRDWDWMIEKSADDMVPADVPSGTHLMLSVGQTYQLDYDVEVTPDYTDSNVQADGTITVTLTGNAIYQTTAFTVTDAITGTGFDSGALTVNCPAGPHSASPGGTEVVCTWSHSFAGVDDVTTLPGDLMNDADVDLTWNSGDTDSDDVQEPVTFGDPTNETDALADVSDDKGGLIDVLLGTADASNPSTWLFEYGNDIPPCEPPGGDRLNTASFVTNDNGDTDQATHAISWECALPPGGCTHTQGYWKTHSEFGPAPYDDTWALVVGPSVGQCPRNGPTKALNDDTNGSGTGGDVEFDEFFNPGANTSNACYFDTMWEKVAGNAWVQLSRQYIAAQLNVLSGADDSCIADAIEDAKDLLAKDGSIRPNDPDRAEAISLIEMLTDYNEGNLSCADHCDDDGSSIED